MALNGIKVKQLDGEAEHMRIEPDVTDCESAPRTLARNVTRTGWVASGNSANMLPKTPEHEPANPSGAQRTPTLPMRITP